MSSKSESRTKTILQLVLPLLLGGVIFYLLYRDMDMNKLMGLLRSNLNYGWLAFSLVFGLLANVIRGLRWEILLQPIVPEGDAKPRGFNTIAVVLGSYTVNMLFPRAGEIWRCTEYKRHEDLPLPQLLGTLITDRLVDVLMLGLILLGIVLGNGSFFTDFLHTHPEMQVKLHHLLQSPWLYLAGVIFLLGFGLLLWWMLKHPENKISKLLSNLFSGVMSILHMRRKGLFIFYSLLIWVCYFIFFYLSFFAFPFTRDLGLSIGLITFALSALSVIAPVQGGIGAWHFMVATALITFGVGEVEAKGFALVVHSIQTIWITLIGLVAILALPIVNRGYKRKRNEAITTNISYGNRN